MAVAGLAYGKAAWLAPINPNLWFTLFASVKPCGFPVLLPFEIGIFSQGNIRKGRALPDRNTRWRRRMRTSIFAMIVVAGSAIAFPATAQQQQAAPSSQPSGQMQPNDQMQRDADKGVKTRNSGESGFVADQDKPGASAHPPGRPEQTTGSSSQPAAPK
jgi:hypothetical protein